jgi:hypothetical protein
MSRNFVVLGKSASSVSFAAPSGNPAAASAASVGSASPLREYQHLIQRLFQGPAAVAIVGGDNGASPESVSPIAERLAAELAACGKQVVIVPVHRLLRMNMSAMVDDRAFGPGTVPQVWVWPEPVSRQIEFFKSRASDDRGNWLDTLRRHFDSILLDCPHAEGAPGVTEVGAMADAVVLAVEAGRTSKEQIQQQQRALQFRGAKVAGSILIQRS